MVKLSQLMKEANAIPKVKTRERKHSKLIHLGHPAEFANAFLFN
jgi:hypothetical protein